MYSTCLYCKCSLGTNEVIETFPVGRRLAFDEAKGRLWVVCTACSRWNLSPQEERWEAVEACEREFRESRRRVTTDNIGLARLPEGLELIRIGKPLRPEFAAWRYGGQLHRRRQRHWVTNLLSWGVTLPAIAVAGAALWIPAVIYSEYANKRVVARVKDDDGDLRPIIWKHAQELRLFPSEHSEGGWAARVTHDRGKTVVEGQDAVRLIGTLLPIINLSGASQQQVKSAVAEIERVGGPEACFSATAAHLERSRHTGLLRSPDRRLGTAPPELRLALEMAVHEQSEQRALEGELAQLENQWKEAEEIASIADSLLVPRVVQERLLRWRAGGGLLS